MSAALVVDRVMAALSPMERVSMVAFMKSPRHGQRELVRLTEMLAGELFIQCLMDTDLGLDQDQLAQAIGATQAKIISPAMWSTLCMSQSALQRFQVAYARRYVEQVLGQMTLPSTQLEAA
jgi:hypothetical protein